MYKVEITKDARENDLVQTFACQIESTIYLSQNTVADDGYRVLLYQAGSLSELREGSKAVLRSYCEDDDSETIYDTLAEAETARDLLDSSDGYQIIDLEQPVGSAPSLLLEARPSLWNRHHESYASARANQHDREDSDRY